MMITNVKKMVAKGMAVGFLAAAFAVFAPVKAEAQHFAVGVQIGGPRYGYYHDDRFRHEDWRRGYDHRYYHHDARWYR